MKIYLNVEEPQNVPIHTMHVCPAGDSYFVNNPPSEFLDTGNGLAKQFEVKFIRGVAEVDDNLGEYMIQRKLARKDSLLRRIAS